MTYAEALAFEVECVTTSINRSLDALAGIVGGKHLASGVHEIPRSAFDAIPGKMRTLNVDRVDGTRRVAWSKHIGSVAFYTDEPADMPATLEHLPPSHPLLAGDPENTDDDEADLPTRAEFYAAAGPHPGASSLTRGMRI